MKKFVLFFMLLLAPMLMAQTQHKVTLHWQPSVTSTVTHYGVYRGTVHLGPYTYLGYTTGTSYANTAGLVEGQTYYYVVVAFTDVDPAVGHSYHSVNSNEVPAMIPVTPTVAAATGLTSSVQ